MTLPPTLRDHLTERLGGPVEQARAVCGGDINQAAQITCKGEAYFVKWHTQAPPCMFPAEAHGLRLMAATNEIRVPTVIAQGDETSDKTGGCPAYLVLEWIEQGNKHGEDTMAHFGEQLAAMHRHHASQHGLDQDNFIGQLPQPNTQTARWAEFYRDQRIGYQMEIARRLGRLPKSREELLTRLMDRLPDLLDQHAEGIPASLIHGDLWGGNYLIDTAGHAVLIDPAVCYGHREMDLAMSELFGGFSGPFYAAYHAAYPSPGYEDRRALYQLYYILVHLNHFGESYGRRVDSLAAHYVGRE